VSLPLRHALTASLRALARGELIVFALALAVAVAAATTVGFFTDRVARAIRAEAGTVLAADLRLESGRAPQNLRAESEAHARGLSIAHTTTFQSVVYRGDEGALATILVAEPPYPLRGHLKVAREAYGESVVTDALPHPGSAFVESRLAAKLGAGVGARLRLGATDVVVAAILADRPDRGSAFSDVAPTVLVRSDDLAASHLLGPASRATYTLLVAGDRDTVDAYGRWLRSIKSPAERLVDVADSSTQLGAATERSGRFLNLAAVITILLSAVAVVMAARRHSRHRRDLVALLKTLGASRREVLAFVATEVWIVACVGALAGVALGYAGQAGLAVLGRSLVPAHELPPPGFGAAWLGLGTAMLMVVGFALAPLLELTRVPPARVFRRDLGPTSLPRILPALLATGALLGCLDLLVRDPRLMGGATVALGACVLVESLLGALLVWGIGRLRPSGVGGVWRYGIANVARRGTESIVEVVAFGIGLTALLLLLVVRNDLLADWRRSLPEDAPNHFLINIPPDQRDAVDRFFSDRGHRPAFAPWVRARLTGINGVSMASRMPKTDRGRGFAEREQNLSWSGPLPPDNQVVEGRWWSGSAEPSPLVSVATEFRDELGLTLGDRLSFDVAGETIEARLVNVRKVRWDGFRPNFFLIFAPGTLDDATGSYLASVHLDASGRRSLLEFTRRFPTVTVLDLEALIAEIRRLIDRAAAAVTYVFLFTVMAGIVVLLAAVHATRDERRYESALLRALGARRREVLVGVAAEFAVLGAVAGVAAAFVAGGMGWWAATRLFGLNYTIDWRLWLLGPLAGAVLVAMTGTLAVWRTVRAPPAGVLRDG
jgi:putative ABC transport system permease protein